jgi:hypothetical protein
MENFEVNDFQRSGARVEGKISKSHAEAKRIRHSRKCPERQSKPPKGISWEV